MRKHVCKNLNNWTISSQDSKKMNDNINNVNFM